jgi:hypothetical protein
LPTCTYSHSATLDDLTGREHLVSKPQDAVALVMIADYLLRLVEQRGTAKPSAGPQALSWHISNLSNDGRL